MSTAFDEGESGFSLAEIAADDALLDALGAGSPPPDGADDLTELLAAWRTDLAADLPTGQLPATPEAGNVVPLTPRRRRWAARIGTGVAAAVVALGGLAITGAQSGPDSPLWPIARLVHPQHTETRTAERTIAAARDAARAGRYDDARRLLDRADAEVGRLLDPDTVRRLRDEIATIRGSLPAPAPPTASPNPAPGSTAPGNGSSGGSTGGAPGSTGGGSTGGGVIPGLPVNPPTGGNGGLPGLPVPVPTVPVPTVPVPTVPVPTLPVPPLPVPSLPVPVPTVTIPGVSVPIPPVG